MQRNTKVKKRVSRDQIAYGISHLEGLTKAQSARVVKEVFQHILLHLAEGAVVDIPGFGKLEGIYTPSRPGSHPKTHEPIEVPEGVRLKFNLSGPAKEVLLKQIQVFREKHQTK